ncbi:universal stress protein [Halobaculum gomorrense]|uniref:Nucleotide-binding universal stress protein, UspA family n=1 Tax=Halobaculum gomorrense TaxID=43928 RepID=A0A1M5QF80_9EURY|nr:universal stress protein [Halobaculum gomorrense]SHH12707.1 Nucleotide-binding universal stress protein, UspA family [Halobaculum gomorrense]
MDVLVAVDGSENCERAIRAAAEFSDRYDAALHVVHVSDSETTATERVIAHAERVLAAVDSDADVELDVIEMTLPTDREVAKELLDLVEHEGFDHVFMGHHGAGVVERAILGSAAEGVVRNATVPVTVVP